MKQISKNIDFRKVAGWAKAPAGDSGRKLSVHRREVEKFLRMHAPIAAETGCVEACDYAIFLCFRRPHPMIRGHKGIYFNYNPRHRAKALRWLSKILKKNAAFFSSSLDFSVPIADARPFLRAGFRIHSTILYGNVDSALQNLLRAKNPPRDLSHLGLQVRTLKLSEMAQLSRLQRKIFSEIPERGYHSHLPSRIRADAKEFRSVIRDPKKGKIYSVWKGKRLAGFFGLFVYENQNTDRRAGVGLMLDFPFQGKGIAKTAYRLLLEEAKRKGVQSFHGGTSQPAVIGLAKIMGRQKTSYLLTFKSARTRQRD